MAIDPKRQPFELLYKDVRAGDWIFPDGAFSCMIEGVPVQVYEDRIGILTVTCNHPHEDRHYLDGQVDNRGVLVGLFRSEAALKEARDHGTKLLDDIDRQTAQEWITDYEHDA